MQTLTIIRPDDMRLHLRGGDVLQAIASYTARQMGRAAIVPGLKPPVISAADASVYKAYIMVTLPGGNAFTSLMTLYLTDQATSELVRETKAAGIVAFKLYPAGTTTNSDSDATDLLRLVPVLEGMAKQDVLFLAHDEVTDPEVDIFDREVAFIERVMKPVLVRVPDLKVVSEHITTAETTRLVLDADDNVATSVTSQHLLLNRSNFLVGGARPRHSYLPVLERGAHRQALVAVVTGERMHKFFFGIDFASHTKSVKEDTCGCTGMSGTMTTIELYVEVFGKAGALDKLGAFSPKNGARSYGIPENTDMMTLVRQSQAVSAGVPYDDGELVLIRAGGEIGWAVRY